MTYVDLQEKTFALTSQAIISKILNIVGSFFDIRNHLRQLLCVASSFFTYMNWYYYRYLLIIHSV
jgi:hypothetical protein